MEQSQIDQSFDRTEPRKPLGDIADQITHFYEKRPNTLQIEHTIPRMDGSYPKDGNITVRLRKDQGSQAFKLNISEALRVISILDMLVKEHISITKSLWKQRSEYGTQ